LNFGSENGKVHYREDLFVGYKHYQARNIRPLFPFGFGLSYTTFELSDMKISEVSSSDLSFSLTVSVNVRNTGDVEGSEAVQLYISLPDAGVTSPRRQLRAFGKARQVQPGKKQVVTMALDKYAVSFWDTMINAWKIYPGVYGVHVGSSSDDMSLHGSFQLKEGYEWNGL